MSNRMSQRGCEVSRFKVQGHASPETLNSSTLNVRPISPSTPPRPGAAAQ
jgi:hypothetical protein